MAEEVLVKEYLTKEMIEAGEKLLRRLGTSAFEIVAAFWLYYPESEEWRLTLASPSVDKEGPRKAYEKIADVLDHMEDKIPTLDVLNIAVVSPNKRLVRALSSVNALAPIALSNKRLPRSNFNGTYVEDIYIYFIKDTVKPHSGESFYVGDKEL